MGFKFEQWIIFYGHAKFIFVRRQYYDIKNVIFLYNGNITRASVINV